MSVMPEDRGSSAIVTPAISYIEERDPHIQTKVRARFRGDIETLAGLGFRELVFYREQFGLFSSVLSLPMSLLMLLKREVMRLEGLRINASFILMSHTDPPTVCVPLALGVKMYTGFTDGFLLVSTNFPSGPASGQSRVIKHSSKVPIAEAWATHQQSVRALEAQGKQIHRSVGFDYYVKVSQQEESAMS
jgi:hypothetical protein